MFKTLYGLIQQLHVKIVVSYHFHTKCGFVFI